MCIQAGGQRFRYHITSSYIDYVTERVQRCF